MFDNLSERLGGILDRLTGRGALTEKDVDAAMREVRRALLEADVVADGLENPNELLVQVPRMQGATLRLSVSK